MKTLLAAAVLAAPQQQPARWPDTPVARLEVLALLQSLNADLLSHDSATLTLERWCDRHGIAAPATVVADRLRDVVKPASPDVRAALKVDGDAVVAYRRVLLRCGDHVLSEADNWYVPARLTPAMNAALATSDVSFGRVVQPLRYSRHTLSARLLWSPLPEGWEMTGLPGLPRGPGPLFIPDHVLEHRAVLATPDGTPFSMVVEDYTSAVLDFPPPPG